MICKSLQDLSKIQQAQNCDTNININANVNVNQCYSSISEISVQSNKDQSNMKIIKQVIQKNVNLFAKQCMQADNSSQNGQENRFIVSVSYGEQQLKIVVRKISCGFINYIYQLSRDYVIKIEKQITDVTVHQIQLFQLANKVNAKVPKLIDHGLFNGIRYILMTKLGGDRLWKYWPVLSQQHKFKAIQQICLQLKKLHSIKMQKYSPRRPYMFDTMQQAVVWYNQQQINNVKKSHMLSILCQNTLQNLAYMQKFMEVNSKILNDERQQPVFVHNDLHFGNILYDIQNHQLAGIIDFDFSRQLVKNYELWHIIQFLQKPEEYVEQQFWYLWKNYKITNQIKYFKSCYPELFQTEALATKIRLYIMDELAFFLSSGRVSLFNEKANLFYRTTWLEDILST